MSDSSALRADSRMRTAVLLAGADADDAVQEAFVKAYAALDLYRGDAPSGPWLLRIVAERGAQPPSDRTSSRGRCPVRLRGERDGLLLGCCGPSPEEEASARNAARRLLGGDQALPERDRRW